MKTSWKNFLKHEMEKPYFNKIVDTLNHEYANCIVYPKRDAIFHAFDFHEIEEIKVVVLGQDPYHGENQAHGLAFSVQDGVTTPPSLRNMFLELHEDLSVNIPSSGNLEKWAEQGVLLLNRILTVRAKEPLSHQYIGWQEFTKNVIIELSQSSTPKVFILWGNYSKGVIPLINSLKHLIITAPHPSPLSAHRGFFGSKPYSKSNKYLESHHREPVNWTL